MDENHEEHDVTRTPEYQVFSKIVGRTEDFVCEDDLRVLLPSMSDEEFGKALGSLVQRGLIWAITPTDADDTSDPIWSKGVLYTLSGTSRKATLFSRQQTLKGE